MKKVSRGGVALFFIDAQGTCPDDVTIRSNQFIWADLDPSQVEMLKEQLVVLLGEPGAEMLLDNQACRTLSEITKSQGVVMERDSE